MTFTALLDLVHRSSTQVPLFMPRHLQTWYSHEYLSCAVIPTGVRESVAGVLSFASGIPSNSLTLGKIFMAMKKKAPAKAAPKKKGDEPVRAGKGKAQPSKSAIKLVKELADKQLGKNNYRLMTDKRGNTFATEKGASSADKARTKAAPGFQFRDITNRTSGPAKKK